MDAAVILVLAGPILLLVTLIVFVPLTIRAERARRRILRQWATQHGWTFADSSRARWVSRMPDGGRYLGVTLTGQIGGRWVTVAEYTYETETVAATVGPRSASNRSRTTHHLIATMVLLDRPFPSVSVSTRGVLSKLGRTLFGDKPTATGNVSFDSRFRISAADPDFARWLVGKPLIDAHLAATAPDWSLVGPELLTYRPGRLHNPSTIPELAAPLIHVADLLGR
ncbi:hypothetical protein ACQPZ2_31245 [Nocardia pseudovaccinii]|uniref:hypothetical protein n=1 Tax=Nocardia pseudovaccinii TaxID=189540 RepID=UPI003D8CEEBC